MWEVWVKRALQAPSTHSIIYGKRWYYTAQNLRDKSTQEFGLITENLSLKKMPRMKWDQAQKKSLVLRLTQRKWDHPAAVAGRWKDDVCFVLADSPTGLSARRFCHFLSFLLNRSI